MSIALNMNSQTQLKTQSTKKIVDPVKVSAGSNVDLTQTGMVLYQTQ